MLFKTRGIVFRFIRYGDTSIIVTIFTEVFGLQTYIVNGVRSKSAKNKIALYQPLTLLDLVVYHRENADILRIKEIQCAYAFRTLTTDIRKSAIGLFLNEIINKAVKEQSHTEDLFQFFYESFEILDKLESSIENFHVIFMIRLSRFLGFGPQNAHEILSGRLLDEHEENLLQRFLSLEYGEEIAITNIQRRNILDAILRFYQHHIDALGEIRSATVLKDVLN